MRNGIRETRSSLAATLIVLLALTFGCERPNGSASQARGAADEEEQVRATSVAWDRSFNDSDLDRLSQLYSETAVSMPYGRPALEGRAAIEADFRDFFATFSAQHETTIISLELIGDWAIEHGTYQLSITPVGGGPPAGESGKHVVVRRRIDGTWKIQMEIWNTDAPPPPP